MPLTAGTRLGPYEIIAAIGAGGMGEVYRARDAKLDRDVAIKVLPDLFAADPERLRRFEREARTLASLNHPNIAQVHGVVEQPPALVMELVEGEDLSQRLARGPIPFEEAIPIARQIAEALEAAHDRGIIHRDLKPANIKVREDGAVKVLDFGLAKAIETSTPDAAPALMNSPTFTSPAMTQIGVILGTAAYMAPEQAKGKAVDRRADIWAFGCVIFEMLTGVRPFEGSDVSETLALILTKDVDMRQLPIAAPAGLARLLRRCLQKDPRERLRDIRDARLQLQDAMVELRDMPTAPVPASHRRFRTKPLLAVIGVLAAAVAALAWMLVARDATVPSLSVVRFSIAPPAGAQFALNFPAAAISPDGSRLVLVVGKGRDPRDTYLVMRALDGSELTRIHGSDGGTNPFFSPDGKWIGFTAKQKLKRVSVDGGAPLDVCDSDWGGGAWGRDDTIVFTPHYSSGLWRVPASGGTPVKLTEPDTKAGELGHFWPQLLPDGKHVLFTRFSTPVTRSRIVVYSLESKQERLLVEGGMHARYVPTGHLIYAGATSIVAVPFDVTRLTVTGTGVPALDDVDTNPSNAMAQLAVSPSGTIAFVRRSAVTLRTELVWLDRKGAAQPVGPGRRDYYDFELSPDGQRLAATIIEASRDVWMYDFSRGVLSRVTSGPASEFGAVWAPDGRRIAFVSERPVFQIFRKAMAGTAPEEPILTGRYDTEPMSFSPDGKLLVYTESHPQTRRDLWMLPIDGDRKPMPLATTPFDESQGKVSPDGRWLAFQSDESGRPEVYVQSFPSGGERWQVSNEGGSQPRWARDGSQLFYLSSDRLMEVSYRTSGGEFVPAKPAMVLQGEFLEYEVAPGSERFLVLRRDPQAQPLPVEIVVNWFEELKKRVAGGVGR